MSLRIIAALCLGLFTFPLFSAALPASSIDEIDEIVAELNSKRDDAEPQLIRDLGALRSRRAMEALVDVYASMASVYMKREVVRALANFDGAADGEQPALQKLMDVATTAKDRELREAAIDALGECQNLGKHFLALIVDSGSQDDIRERAMDRHTAMATEDDHAWYAKLYEPVDAKAQREKDKKDKKDKKKKDKKKKGEEAEEESERKVYRLQSIRHKALAVIIDTLDDDDVYKAATEDRGAGVRRICLRELQQRDHRKIEAVARKVMTSGDQDLAANQVVAAQILIERNGAKEADKFIDLAGKFITFAELRRELASLLSELEDEGVNKKLGRLVGKGKVFEKTFALEAARKIDDDKLSKKMRKGLTDKDIGVRMLTASVLADRKDAEAIPAIQKLIDKSKDEVVIGAMIDALSRINGADAAWREELLAYTASETTEIKNAALIQLGNEGADEHFDLFITNLTSPVWSTRLASLRALQGLRSVRAIGPIIARMESETGRMLHEFANVLWVLTGEPFNTRQKNWKAWWEKEQDGFAIISPEDLEKRAEEEETRRLKEISAVSFFGIRIISHRVIFIIDVSGSMNEVCRPVYVGDQGLPRIDVAKRELAKAVEGLEKAALYNIVPFSSDVSSWLDGGVAGANEKSRDEALEFVDRLAAVGGTNLYGAIKHAFEDPDVDSIYILGDGEPTVGEVTDPHQIREDVKLWNAHRNIVIHTVAIGGSLQVLEWLAEDTGGSHVKFQ